MDVKGSAYQTTNIRKEAKVVDSPTNVIGKLYKGETFTGSTVQSGSEIWIKLASVNGKAVTDVRYVAGWVVNYEAVVVTPPPDEADSVVKAVVHFSNGTTQELFPK